VLASPIVVMKQVKMPSIILQVTAASDSFPTYLHVQVPPHVWSHVLDSTSQPDMQLHSPHRSSAWLFEALQQIIKARRKDLIKPVCINNPQLNPDPDMPLVALLVACGDEPEEWRGAI